MTNVLIENLKNKLASLAVYGGLDAETKRNALKEELQFYILNFIYHHSKYSQWTMYGGSALRICHGLNRMSIDLDFELADEVLDSYLEELAGALGAHFESTYGVGSDLLKIKKTNNRGVRLCFYVADELGIGTASDQVVVKIDLNHFVAPKTVIERRLINHDQLSFAIKLYNMSALMASKIAAIFLRGQRGVGQAVYEEKGRDIYDLLWYMEKKVVPDLDYLEAKQVDISNLRVLFDKLTIKMNGVSDANLKNDLTPLFVNKSLIEYWLGSWRSAYLSLVGDYKISAVTELDNISITKDFRTDVFSFVYRYKTDTDKWVRISYSISDYWFNFKEGELNLDIDENLTKLVEFRMSWSGGRASTRERILQYVTLFYKKTEDYLVKTGRVLMGDSIDTKTVRMTADSLNPKEQIVLNRSALLSCELEDLLR